jgi:DNA mismatch repair protein MutS2
VAILEHFRARQAMTFVTTHHSRLKAYAAETPEAVNAAMEFDEATLQPTYRLLIGLPGKSSALEIAERLGLETSIVEKARTLLHPAEAEVATLLAKLHEQKAEFERGTARLSEQRQELEAHRTRLEQEFQQKRRAKLQELDARLEETLKQYEKNWEQTVAEFRAQAEAAKLAKRMDRKAAALKQEVREEWNAQVLETLGAPEAAEEVTVDTPPVVGDRVRVANLSTLGTVIRILDAGQLEIELGRIKMRVHQDEVRVLVQSRGKAAPPAPAASKPAPGGSHAREKSPTIETAAEINVIGTSAEQARELVDKFLDQAFVEGRFRLRVIHGFGKGILRRSLHEMFTSHPHVEKFYPAPPHEGGAGATIVELKM